MGKDVLIIGGGLASRFVTVKAAENNVLVTLAEKANVEHIGSNSTGIYLLPLLPCPQDL
jgi:succinate dehydrogenase/fumarate reductase flavoprotein subunit